MAACPRLTELTLIYLHPDHALVSETGDPLDTVGTTHSATLELVSACKVLPDFDTIQIVHGLDKKLLIFGTHGYDQVGDGSMPSMEQQWQALRNRAKGMRDLVINCLKGPEIGREEGEGKKITLRVIELGKYRLPGELYLDSVRVEKVEEYEVWGFGGGDP